MSSTVKKRQLNENKNDIKTKPSSKRSTKGQKKNLTSRLLSMFDSNKSAISTESEHETKFFTTILKWLLFAFALPPILNYGALQNERQQLLKENTTLFDIGFGQKLYMSCQGKGLPTVILDAPSGMTSGVWGHLQKELVSQNVKVCVYDRAGLGFSDREPYFNLSDPMERAVAGPSPFTTHRMVQDLHRLVTFANPLPEPFLLIGSQLGALNSLAYAKSHSPQVSQVVLIDPVTQSMFEENKDAMQSNEKQQQGSWRQFWTKKQIPFSRFLQTTALLGLNRIAVLLGFLDVPGVFPVNQGDQVNYEESIDPQENQDILTNMRLHHFMTDSNNLGAASLELENLEVSAQQVESILSSLDQSQLNVTTTTVITGNYFDELMPTALNRAWSKAAQHTVSRLQPKCQHYVINGADHRMIYNQHVQELSAPIIRIIKRIKHSLSTK